MKFKVGDKVIVIKANSQVVGTRGVILKINTGHWSDTVEVRYETQDFAGSYPFQKPSTLRLITPLDELL